MNWTSAILTLLALMLVGYIIWLCSKPAVSPLVTEEQEKALTANLPDDIRSGNSIITLTDFDSMLSAMRADIDSARSYVHLLFFKYEDDPVSRSLADLLAAKAAEGVEVRLMYDDAVNKSRYKLYREMESKGIETLSFAPMHIPFLKKSDNYRNHRKIVVVDGKVAYIGGMNIAERYGKGLKWGCWRDTQIRIEGPAAAACELSFARDWAHAGGTLLSDARYYPETAPAGDIEVDVVCSGPIGEGPVIRERICDMLDRSKTRFWIESPYLIPGKEMMRSLCTAARRGVDVRVILPPRGDHGVLTPLATKAHIADVIDAGVKVAFYRKGYMHSKTAVCDGSLVTVGSTNIDVRSYVLDLEINVFIDNAAYAKDMEDIFLADEAQSDYIDKNQWASRSIFEKAGEAIAKIFSFQL